MLRLEELRKRHKFVKEAAENCQSQIIRLEELVHKRIYLEKKRVSKTGHAYMRINNELGVVDEELREKLNILSTAKYETQNLEGKAGEVIFNRYRKLYIELAKDVKRLAQETMRITRRIK